MNNIIDQLQKYAVEQGEKKALVYEDKFITYKELDEKSSKVAAMLQKRGVQREDVIPIYLPRSMDYIVAMIGILKAGGAFVGLSMEFPEERINYIVKDCKAKFIFNEEMLIESESEKSLFMQVEIRENDAAIVLYTSGSTGNPKGMIYDHKCFNGIILKNMHYTTLLSDDVVLSIAPFYFISLIMDIMSPFLRGCTVHIAADEKRKDIRKIEDYIEQHRITTCYISPQLLKYFKNKSSSLRFVMTGSERVSRIFPEGYKLLNVYGSSECFGITTFEIDKEYENTPIGKPTDGRQIYILDEEGNEVPDGEEGQICISGYMARGYNNLPKETERTFRRNPFSIEKDSRLFYSGDIGKKLPDGNLLYINRKDWMVKINGQRVEPGEIEICMDDIEEIESTVVKAFENNGQTYLCAYYKCKASIEQKDIIEALLKKLPKYMIPRFFVKVDDFPINQNGKLDRKSLKLPEVADYKSEYIAPENEIQRMICDAFGQVLKQKEIGIDDDYFALGGDSISVIELSYKLEDQGIMLELKDIYYYPTPRQLSNYIEKDKAKKEQLPQIEEVKEVGPFDMSDCQVRMTKKLLHSEQDGLNPSIFDLDCYYILQKPIDVPKLRVAAQKVCEEMDVFSLKANLKELKMVPNADGDLKLIIEEHSDTVKILIKGTHLLIDGIFNQRILERLSAYYKENESEKANLNPVTSFRSFVKWMKNLEEVPLYKEAEKYYIGLKEKAMDYKFEPKPKKNYTKWKVIVNNKRFEFGNEVGKLCKKYKCSRYNFFFSVFMQLLLEINDGTAFCTAVTNQRTFKPASTVVGCLSNRFYVGLYNEKNKSIEEIIQKTTEAISNGIKYGIYPAWKILEGKEAQCPYIAFNYSVYENTSNISFDGKQLSKSINTFSEYFNIPLLLSIVEVGNSIDISFVGTEDMVNMVFLSELTEKYIDLLEKSWSLNI